MAGPAERDADLSPRDFLNGLRTPERDDEPLPQALRLRSDHQGSVVLGEEILVETFELDCPARANTHTMFDHQVRQALTVN